MDLVNIKREYKMAPNERRSQRKFNGQNRSQLRREYLLGDNPRTGDSDQAVPLLRCWAKNNWLKFKEKIAIACTEKFGDLGWLIDVNDYYTPPRVNEDLYPDWQTNEIQKMLYLDAEKA